MTGATPSQAGGRPWPAWAFGLAYGGLFGTVLALRIGLLERAFDARAASAVAVLVAGAVVAGVIAAWIGNRIAGTWPTVLRLVLMMGGLICGALFMSGGFYSVLIRDILGQFEMDDLADAGGIADFIFAHGSAAYLMLLGGWTLLFPWPLPVASAAAAWLFATRRR